MNETHTHNHAGTPKKEERDQRELRTDERNLLLIFMGKLNFFDLTELESDLMYSFYARRLY